MINETYADEVESIVEARVEDDGAIVAIAQDEGRLVGFRYTDSQVSTKVLNASDFEDGEPEFAEDAPNTIDLYVTQLREQAAPIVDSWVAKLGDALGESGDLAEFSEKLLTLYPQLPGDNLRAIMGDALMASSLAGAGEDVSEEGKL